MNNSLGRAYSNLIEQCIYKGNQEMTNLNPTNRQRLTIQEAPKKCTGSSYSRNYSCRFKYGTWSIILSNQGRIIEVDVNAKLGGLCK